MKLVQIQFHSEYAEAIEAILDDHGISAWLRIPRIEGRDVHGKHDGSQAFPGHLTLVQAVAADDGVDALLQALAAFRDRKPAHGHLTALVLPIEARVSDTGT